MYLLPIIPSVLVRSRESGARPGDLGGGVVRPSHSIASPLRGYLTAARNVVSYKGRYTPEKGGTAITTPLGNISEEELDFRDKVFMDKIETLIEYVSKTDAMDVHIDFEQIELHTAPSILNRADELVRFQRNWQGATTCVNAMVHLEED